MLANYLIERPWTLLKKNAASPPDTLFIERGGKKGGTYMPATCAAKRVDVNYVGPVPIQDKYLGTVMGQAYSIRAETQPWLRLCEPVDYEVNVRLHSTMLWRNTVTERIRHTARLEEAMKDPDTKDFFENLQARYYAAYKEAYEYYFSEYESKCSYDHTTFDAWVKDHEESSTGSKDEYGYSYTWGRLAAMPHAYEEMYADVLKGVKAVIAGFEKAEFKVLSHDYSFVPEIAFAAGRNRNESSFKTNRDPEGVIVPGAHIYDDVRYRDRPAGGLRIFSWLGAFLEKRDAQELEREMIRRAWKAADVTTHISGPLFTGLESYVKVLEADKKAYLDMANCEKFVGSQGFGLERLCFRGGRETSLNNALCELSGGVLTTPNNMIMNGINVDEIQEIMGLQYDIEMHGDNSSWMGADDQVAADVANEYPHVYSREDVWLGHGQSRVVGVKLTKDSKDQAISITSDLRERPQMWHYTQDKASEATAALLCRDVISRHFEGPTYLTFLKECASRAMPPESLWGGWNGLSDHAQEIAEWNQTHGEEIRAFEESRSIVEDNAKTLFE
jgi:hypothetical protein